MVHGVQQRIPATALSRVSSYDWLASSAFQPIGFAITGPIAALPAVGVSATLVGAGLLSLASNLGVLTVRELRNLTWMQRETEEEGGRAPVAQGPLVGPVELEER